MRNVININTARLARSTARIPVNTRPNRNVIKIDITGATFIGKTTLMGVIARALDKVFGSSENAPDIEIVQLDGTWPRLEKGFQDPEALAEHEAGLKDMGNFLKKVILVEANGTADWANAATPLTTQQIALHGTGMIDLPGYAYVGPAFSKPAPTTVSLEEGIAKAFTDDEAMYLALSDEEIETIMLDHGYSKKAQPDGTLALNPYVYEAARALLAESIRRQHRQDVAKTV